uniref:Setae polypeptide n=1 Tax=Ochrogaster lunifer TaxID=319761 RepID=A0AA49IGV5_OCHLU|nr:setae polypeptide [Ochrogaster lunifer]
MKTVLVLAGLIALVFGGTVPNKYNYKTKTVDSDFITRQKKVLSLVENVEQVTEFFDYYPIGKNYSIEDNIDNYTNKKAVEEFLKLYRTGYLPKYFVFSVFQESLRDEAIAYFRVLYYAKDFETFYKTAAFGKVYLNEQQFLYAYYIAVLQRPDTQGIVLPAPYETFPNLFVNMEAIYKIYYAKMGEITNPSAFEHQYGIVKEDSKLIFYSNYSNALSYPNEESRLSYFTEDIGWNSYYFFFHTHLPFWWNSEKFGGVFKERRGEVYFSYYQQMLARYYFERLTNGLPEIPKFSWFSKFKTGYYPHMTTYTYPFAQRSNDYEVHDEENYEAIRFLDAYEKTFFQYLQKGHFKAFNKDVDFHKSNAINFVGNYWQTNADLYSEDVTKDYQHSYEVTARRVLGAAPERWDKYTFMPSALDFYQTSMRDPAFYQLYQRIIDYLIDFKEYLEPYTYEELHFVGVKINDVKVDKMETYFDYYDFNATKSVYFNLEEMKSERSYDYIVRQPRLNHKPFSVEIDVKSDVASDAVFKVFMGPKYDSNGFPISLEQDWMKFVELDWFIHKLVPGENKIVRKSDEFIFFKDDSVPIEQIYKLLEQGKVPHDMSETPYNIPRRLMLPKGTKGGFPFQLFVFVYPYNGVNKQENVFSNYLLENKAFGFPFDRPLNEIYFKQPNMFFEEVRIYHEGSPFAWEYNVPAYYAKHKKA